VKGLGGLRRPPIGAGGVGHRLDELTVPRDGPSRRRDERDDEGAAYAEQLRGADPLGTVALGLPNGGTVHFRGKADRVDAAADGTLTADETLIAGEPAAADGGPIADESPAGTGAPDAVLEEDIVVIDAETAVKDPALTETAPDTATGAVPGGLGHDPDTTGAPGQPPAAQVAAAAPASPDGAAARSGISAQRWSEILVTFVDDPRGSVKMAAAAVDSAIDEFVTSVQARQRALASSWQGSDTDTEQLRAALREYRRLAAQVQQMSPSAETGDPASAAGS